MDRSRPAHQNGRRRSHPIGPATCTLGVPSCIALIALAPTSSSAQEGAFARVLQCKNQDARVELYLPTAIAHAGDGWQALEKTTPGYLRARPLAVPARASRWSPCASLSTKDKRGVVVDQYTRGLPPSTVPLKGGKVSFDKRFAENMTCGPVEAK